MKQLHEQQTDRRSFDRAIHFVRYSSAKAQRIPSLNVINPTDITGESHGLWTRFVALADWDSPSHHHPDRTVHASLAIGLKVEAAGRQILRLAARISFLPRWRGAKESVIAARDNEKSPAGAGLHASFFQVELVSDLDTDARSVNLDTVVVVIVMPVAMLDHDVVAIAVPLDAVRATDAVRALPGANTVGQRGRRVGTDGQHRGGRRNSKKRCFHLLSSERLHHATNLKANTEFHICG